MHKHPHLRRPQIRSQGRTRLATLAAVPALLLALAACGAGSAEKSADSGSAGGAAMAQEPAPAGVRDDGAGGSAAFSKAATDPTGSQPGTSPGRPVDPAVGRAVISSGTIRLSSKDVAGVRADVDRLLTRYGGFLADEETRTDRKGRPSSTSLTLRVPSDRFDRAMRSFGGLGRLVSARRSAEDVTTQVIDVQQRIKAQQVGLTRLRQLMSRSATLPNLLQVEREVTDRQAQLDSLEARLAYLSDQTSLSTITLTVDRKAPPPPPVHHTGFLGGLQNGWQALVVVVRGALVSLGTVLPFAVVALALWLPGRLVVRRLRRTRPAIAAEG